MEGVFVIPSHWKPGWYRGLIISLDKKLVPDLGAGFFYWFEYHTYTIRNFSTDDAD